MRPHLILFTRVPCPGAVKTRMIPQLGERGAAALHRELTEHTLRTIDALQEEVTTVGSGELVGIITTLDLARAITLYGLASVL